MELKSVTASVYFSSDAANPDTYTKFYTDIQMFTTTMGSPIPGCSCASSCRGRPRPRKTSGRAATSRAGATRSTTTPIRPREGELDPVKRAALFIAMNDMVVGDPVVIPVVYRPRVSAVSRRLRAHLSGWDNDVWDLRNWYNEA